MSFDYIARAYGKTFSKGQRVVALGKRGKVTGATHYVEVKLDGLKHSNNYHPSDVEPEVADQGDPPEIDPGCSCRSSNCTFPDCSSGSRTVAA